MVGSDGERVVEHRWRSRKLATGSFGAEEGWRRGLHGRPTSGGANGGGADRSRQKGAQGSALGLRSDEEKVKNGSEIAEMV